LDISLGAGFKFRNDFLKNQQEHNIYKILSILDFMVIKKCLFLLLLLTISFTCASSSQISHVIMNDGEGDRVNDYVSSDIFYELFISFLVVLLIVAVFKFTKIRSLLTGLSGKKDRQKFSRVRKAVKGKTSGAKRVKSMRKKK
jgi:hypothetical protein